MKTNESGRSMIEVVGVLAVMGLITAGAFVLISSIMSSQKISRLDDEVSAIVSSVRLLYNTSDNFSGLDGNALTTLGFSGGNPYGGVYGVKENPGRILGTASDDGVTYNGYETFYLTITGLTADQCTTLVSRRWGGNQVQRACCTDELCSLVKAGAYNENCNEKSNAVRIIFGKAQ